MAAESACSNCDNLQDQLRKQADEFKHTEQEYLDEISKLKEALKAERNSNDNLKEELNAARRNLPVSVAPQEAVGCSETSNDGSMETAVVRSLGCIVRDECMPYHI